MARFWQTVMSRVYDVLQKRDAHSGSPPQLYSPQPVSDVAAAARKDSGTPRRRRYQLLPPQSERHCDDEQKHVGVGVEPVSGKTLHPSPLQQLVERTSKPRELSPREVRYLETANSDSTGDFGEEYEREQLSRLRWILKGKEKEQKKEQKAKEQKQKQEQKKQKAKEKKVRRKAPEEPTRNRFSVSMTRKAMVIFKCTNPECAEWEAHDSRFGRCGRCEEARYCSWECAKQDWRRHKKKGSECTALQRGGTKKKAKKTKAKKKKNEEKRQ